MSELKFVLTMIASPRSQIKLLGEVTRIAADRVEVEGLSQYVKIGDLLATTSAGGEQFYEVCNIDGQCLSAIPFNRNIATKIGDRVEHRGGLSISPNAAWKGRVVNALGQPIDGLAPLPTSGTAFVLDRAPPGAMQRVLIDRPFRTGVTVIDTFLPLCIGQRIGIMAGSGVGKSTLLAMLAQAPAASTIVLALIGERGREVREFLEITLGHSRQRVIAVVATAEEPVMMRRLAAKTAMAVSEHLRDDGEQVLLIVDSLTRFAHAERDFALAAGQMPVARGFPPSVFRELAFLLERAGTSTSGSITLIASVLIDGDDHNDPVADAVRGIVDGHIVLDRAIASDGRWPAVNVLQSVSRLADRVWSPQERKFINELRQAIARYEDTRDLRAMGEYRAGQSAELDWAVSNVPSLYSALRQEPRDGISADPFQLLAKATAAGKYLAPLEISTRTG